MIKKSNFILLFITSLLFVTKLKAQTIPNYFKDLGREAGVNYFDYTANADTAFYLGWYLTLEKHPQAFSFLDASIAQAKAKGDIIGMKRLESLKAQKLRDIKGESTFKSATVIKEIKEPEIIPIPEPIPEVVESPEVFHLRRIKSGTANDNELIESHQFLANFYSLEDSKNLSSRIKQLIALRNIFEKQKNDKKVIELTNTIAIAQVENRDDENAKINHQKYIDSFKDEKIRINKLKEIADYYFEKDLYENSLFFREKLLVFGQDKQIDTITIDAKNDIGTIFQVLGIKERAFSNHQEALKTAKNRKDTLRITQSLIKLGVLNGSIKEYEIAHQNFDNALEMALANKFIFELIDIYNQKANIFLAQKKPGKAIKNIKKCNVILDEIGDDNGIILNLNIIGDINRNFNFNEEAKKSYQKSLDRALETKKQSLLSMNYADYGLILINENNNTAALDSCTKGYKIAKSIKYMEFIANNCKCLHLATKNERKFQKSVEYHEEYTAIKDSLFNIAKLKQVSKLQARYEFEKQIVEKDYSIQLLEEKNKKRNLQLASLTLLALLLGLGIALIYRNLGQKNKHNNELSNLNGELKKMNYLQLTNNQKLKEANKILENFAAVAAHDLKVPLRSISSFSEMLLRKNKEKFDDKDKEYFSFIAKDATRLQDMITALLAFSKIGKDLPPTEYVNLNDICDAVLKRLQVKINEKNAIVNVEVLESVNVNQPLIEQVFQNIISNSLKFQKKYSIAKINISGKNAEEKDFYEISIADNGIGIEQEFLSSIFELFNRINRRSEYEGNGIGLATCKKIIEHYGGKISVKSVKDKGTIVTFTLPQGF